MAASSTKGAKKGRRFNQPRSEAAKIRCAKRKQDRIASNKAAAKANDGAGSIAWELAKRKRAERRAGVTRKIQHRIPSDVYLVSYLIGDDTAAALKTLVSSRG